jgi:hypothetical protein
MVALDLVLVGFAVFLCADDGWKCEASLEHTKGKELVESKEEQ